MLIAKYIKTKNQQGVLRITLDDENYYYVYVNVEEPVLKFILSKYSYSHSYRITKQDIIKEITLEIPDACYEGKDIEDFKADINDIILSEFIRREIGYKAVGFRIPVIVELDRFVYREILNKLKYKEKSILEELEELSEK